MARDTGPAKLPALPFVSTGNTAVDRLLQAICERLEVREGSRGNPYERVLLVRDLSALGVDPALVASTRGRVLAGTMAPGALGARLGGRDLSAEAFDEAIRSSRLYQNLLTSLNDPSRFDDLPEKVQALLGSIADEARKRGADVREIEMKIQDAKESLAYRITEITAAVENAQAGVREVSFASANANNATAGVITQVQARLDSVEVDPSRIDPTVYATLAALIADVPLPSFSIYYQVDDPASAENLLYRWDGSSFQLAGRGTTVNAVATLEQSLIATADRVKGVSAEYMVKVLANGASAGFGLSASEDPEGNTESAFIVQAGKFAVVSAADVITDPKNPPLNRIPFGIDTVTNTVFINGQLRINSGGQTLDDLTSDTSLYISYDTQFFKFDTTGAVVNATVTLTANLTGTLAAIVPPAVVTWSVIAGYTGTLPAAGTSNTLTLDEVSMTSDAATFQAEYVDGATTYTDVVTILKLRDGTDSITGFLSNESHTVPANNTGTVSSFAGASGQFRLFQGSTAFTLGVAFSVAANPDGVTASIDASGNYAVTANGTWALLSDGATVTFRASFDGATIDKVFTLTKSRAGAAGVAGATTYTWFAYANNSTGTSGFTTGAPGGRTYIGIAYNKTTPTEGTNPAEYDWSLLQGATGSSGLNGGANITASSTAGSAGAAGTQSNLNTVFTANANRSPQIGDALTLHNQTAKWSQTWVRGASSWAAATLFINGDVVINGTLVASTISTSKVVIAPIGSYAAVNLAISSGQVFVTMNTSSVVVTPLWSHAIDAPSGVLCTVAWVNNSANTCTFAIRAMVVNTAAPYTGSIPTIKIWMF